MGSHSCSVATRESRCDALVDAADPLASSAALSGAVAATLGLTGGSTGPVTATQNRWMVMRVNGTLSYVPVWV